MLLRSQEVSSGFIRVYGGGSRSSAYTQSVPHQTCQTLGFILFVILSDKILKQHTANYQILHRYGQCKHISLK